MTGRSRFTEGDEGDSLYIVKSGEVVIKRRADDGKIIELARFLPGDMFGELELFNRARRTADACGEPPQSVQTATEALAEESVHKKTVLVRFPKQGIRIEDILKSYPSISARVLHQFIVLISNRIRNANNLIKKTLLSSGIEKPGLQGQAHRTFQQNIP